MLPELKYTGQFGSKILWFLLLCSAIFVNSGCAGEEKKPFQRYEGPQEEIFDVGVKYSEGGRVTVEMTTPVQLRYLSGDKVFPDSVNIVFFDSLGTKITTVRSDSGRYDNNKNIYTVIGNVIVVNTQKQEYLYTAELNWNPSTQKVYNDKPNRILRNRTSDIVNGVGLDARQDFSEMALRRVTGIITM